MNTPRLHLLAIAIGLSLLTPMSAQARSSCDAPTHVLGQQEVWKRAKFPWLYPTAPAQHVAAESPALSQQEVWKRTKFPWLYPAPPAQHEAKSPPPNQQEVWKRAKFPWLYPTTAGSTRSNCPRDNSNRESQEALVAASAAAEPHLR